MVPTRPLGRSRWDALYRAYACIIEGLCNLVSQIPNPKFQTPNPKSQTPNPKSCKPESGFWNALILTTKISPTEKLLWAERITETPDSGWRARGRMGKISPNPGFHRGCWLFPQDFWDLGFAWDLDLGFGKRVCIIPLVT